MTQEEYRKYKYAKIETEKDVNDVVDTFKRKLAVLNLPTYEDDINKIVEINKSHYYGKAKGSLDSSILGAYLKKHPEAYTIEWHYVWRDI